MADESITLKALTELKTMRMRACAELQNRTGKSPVYARSTALELLSIEKPWTLRSSAQRDVAQIVVPELSQRGSAAGMQHLAWSGPLETQTVAKRFECTTPVCTWAHYAGVLPLDELIVLGESMMRRNRMLKRAEIGDFTRYLGRSSNFDGIRNCRLALRVMRENTDSSMETRTNLSLMRYGLPSLIANYELRIPGTARSVFLDMAYPELKLAIEFDGSYHRFSPQQVLKDDKRREDIESADWTYVKVTVVDLANEAAREALAQRVAHKMERILGCSVPLEPLMPMEQACNGHRLRRKPIWDRSIGRK